MPFDDEMTERERWAEDHGYYHFTCNRCGVSGWTDSTPECNCPPEVDEEEPEDL
jgi:hypothetical protein